MRYIDGIGAHLPNGIRLAHDGRYRAMLSLRLKNYALLNDDGTHGHEGVGAAESPARAVLSRVSRRRSPRIRDGRSDGVRERYFALGERIRLRAMEPSEISQWAMVHDDTLRTQTRLKRLVERLPQRVRDGERLQIYEREDGELASIEEYAGDENVSYLLRRLHDTANRFRDLFAERRGVCRLFPAPLGQAPTSRRLEHRKRRRNSASSDEAPDFGQGGTKRKQTAGPVDRAVIDGLAVWTAAAAARPGGGGAAGPAGGPAAASPPGGSPPQYSPALRRVTTGFGMGPGGATALSATGPPGGPPPPAAGARRRRCCVVWPGTARGRARGAGGRRGRRRRGRGGRGRAAAGPGGAGRAGPRGGAPGAARSGAGRGRFRPRPLARLGSGRLPAVHPPPIDPVVCRGPYSLSGWGDSSWGGVPA